MKTEKIPGMKRQHFLLSCLNELQDRHGGQQLRGNIQGYRNQWFLYGKYNYLFDTLTLGFCQGRCVGRLYLSGGFRVEMDVKKIRTREQFFRAFDLLDSHRLRAHQESQPEFILAKHRLRLKNRKIGGVKWSIVYRFKAGKFVPQRYIGRLGRLCGHDKARDWLRFMEQKHRVQRIVVQHSNTI